VYGEVIDGGDGTGAERSRRGWREVADIMAMLEGVLAQRMMACGEQERDGGGQYRGGSPRQGRRRQGTGARGSLSRRELVRRGVRVREKKVRGGRMRRRDGVLWRVQCCARARLAWPGRVWARGVLGSAVLVFGQ
jgi:hypothetical protein